MWNSVLCSVAAVVMNKLKVEHGANNANNASLIPIQVINLRVELDGPFGSLLTQTILWFCEKTQELSGVLLLSALEYLAIFLNSLFLITFFSGLKELMEYVQLVLFLLVFPDFR